MVLQEAAGGFLRNSDLRQASSLAFYSTLALIPALLLLTFLLSVGIGSSQAAQQKTSELILEVIPRFGEVILGEVGSLSSHPRMAGTLNLLVLTWSLTPLVSSLREIANGIFRARNPRALLVSKAIDLAMGMAFIIGLAGMIAGGLLLHYLARFSSGLHRRLPVLDGLRPWLSPWLGPWLGFVVPFLITVMLVWGVYYAFTGKVRNRHLLAGALTTTGLWFLLRPAFTLFLTYDQGYGFAFGSFKSIFIVIIWIYYSLAVLLFGLEVAAALHRGETLLIKRLLEGRRGLPGLARSGLLLETPEGWEFFHQGDPAAEMYFLLAGAVSVRKGGAEVAVIRAGHFFGEMSLLLGLDRSATVVALEPCRCVVLQSQNFEEILLEFPGMVREMLVELAGRLREAAPREAAVHADLPDRGIGR
jgi:membrane protein